MKTETIITKIQEQAESYGCIPEMQGAIRRMYSFPASEFPRCHICGRPFRVVDMAADDQIFVGCPNDAHREYDHQIRAYASRP